MAKSYNLVCYIVDKLLERVFAYAERTASAEQRERRVVEASKSDANTIALLVDERERLEARITFLEGGAK